MTILKFVHDALPNLSWCQAMLDKLSACHNNGISKLVPLPSGNLLLVVGVFLLSKLVLMVLLIFSKFVLWPKVTHKFLGWIPWQR